MFVCIFVTCADARLTACSVAGGAVVGMFALELDSCTDYNFFVFFLLLNTLWYRQCSWSAVFVCSSDIITFRQKYI